MWTKLLAMISFKIHITSVWCIRLKISQVFKDAPIVVVDDDIVHILFFTVAFNMSLLVVLASRRWSIWVWLNYVKKILTKENTSIAHDKSISKVVIFLISLHLLAWMRLHKAGLIYSVMELILGSRLIAYRWCKAMNWNFFKRLRFVAPKLLSRWIDSLRHMYLITR